MTCRDGSTRVEKLKSIIRNMEQAPFTAKVALGPSSIHGWWWKLPQTAKCHAVPLSNPMPNILEVKVKGPAQSRERHRAVPVEYRTYATVVHRR